MKCQNLSRKLNWLSGADTSPNNASDVILTKLQTCIIDKVIRFISEALPTIDTSGPSARDLMFM